MLISIFGTGRNGSTLIGRLLDGMPDTYVHPVEANFLSVLNDLAAHGRVGRATWHNATTAPLRDLHKPVETRLILETYQVQIDEVRDAYVNRLREPIVLGEDPIRRLSKKAAYTAQEFVPAFLEAMAGWTCPGQTFKRFVFKTGETPYVDDYMRQFPGLKAVHLFRNPIDVYSSQKRTILNKSGTSWLLGRDNLETMVDKRWIPHAEAWRRYRDSPDHILVRYEDMTSEPVKTISSICQWLGAEMPAEPTKQTVLGGKLLTSLPKNPSQKGLETPVEVVSNLQSRHSYDQVLSRREAGFITRRTHPLATQMGYFQGVSRPGKIGLAASWIRPDHWEFMNSGSIYRILRSFFSLFYRRYYILRHLQ